MLIVQKNNFKIVKICHFVLKQNDTNNFINVILKNCIEHKLLIFNNNFYYINNSIDINRSSPILFKIKWINLNNENELNYFLNFLAKQLKLCHSYIQKIPDTNGIINSHYGIREGTNEETIIQSLYYFIQNTKQYDILLLISHIVFKINASHLYNNGNKRTSISFAATILKYFSLNLRFSNNFKFALQYYEEVMCKIANFKNSFKSEEECIFYIYNEFLKNICFDDIL